MKYLNWIINTPVADSTYPKYIEKIKTKKYRPAVIGAVYCKDGAYVSVQASCSHYCSPRYNYGKWYEVECGFPSVIPPVSWRPFAEQWNVSIIERIKRFIRACNIVSEWATQPSDYFRTYRREFTRMILPPPRTTVYGYMPIENVKEFIKLHKGEDTKRSFNENKQRLG